MDIIAKDRTHQICLTFEEPATRKNMPMRAAAIFLSATIWVTLETRPAAAQIEISSQSAIQRVFAGSARRISLVISNSSAEATNIAARIRMYQTTSATAVALQDVPWRQFRALPGQTMLESARLDFPSVRGETPFLIQWLEGTNRVMGETRVLVYPTNLLEEIKPLLANEPLGVFDPEDVLKPLLKGAGIAMVDLESHNFENFTGRLAIVGPFTVKSQMRDGLAAQIRSLAKRGAGVVWMLAPREEDDKIQPSFYTVPIGDGAVVVVQAETFANPAENPEAQLNLIHFAQLAVCPQPPRLPDFDTNP